VDGVVSAGNKRVSYGELVGGKSFALKLDHTKPAAGKDPKDYKLVGKPVPRVDIPDKVTGRFTYTPPSCGMTCARARSPRTR